MCLGKGCLELVLPGSEANNLTWGRKGSPVGLRVGEDIQINYKLNFIQDSIHFKSKKNHNLFTRSIFFLVTFRTCFFNPSSDDENISYKL